MDQQRTLYKYMKNKKIDLKPIILFIGNYGSGKTEVSVNYAVHLANLNEQVRIADLDLVNPYFRSREVSDILKEMNVNPIIPEEGLLNADLPILIPQIQGAIRSPRGTLILDVGGDNVGSTVLGSLDFDRDQNNYDMLQVVNAKRPFTETAEGSAQIAAEIEASARLKISGVVGNTHLMDETDEDTIIQGYRHAVESADKLGVPLKFITCEKKLLDTVNTSEIKCPILPITRLLLPPWKKKTKIGKDNFLL